ncbi:MAG: PDZ domain-containing protein [Clostridiaceae bacterium]|jgi:serine protease Do|nr:PDZ domain-containing protein [Clostridiaceae bacterium]
MNGFGDHGPNNYHGDPAEEDRSFKARYRYEVNPVDQPLEDKYDDLKTSSFYNEGYKKPGRGRLKGLLTPLLMVALISSLLTGGLVASYFVFVTPSANASDARQDKTGNSNIIAEGTGIKQVEIINTTESPVVAVAEKASPSIVGIDVKYVYSDLWFGQHERSGQGSGIVYRSDGYIVTNNHVIEAAMDGGSKNKIAKGASIQVILPNRIDEPYDAVVIGRDPRTDIAVLRIDATDLPAAEFGDSDSLKVGEMAVAIGNPAGLEFMGSVTVGYISGLNRSITFDDGRSMKLIQTDAAINPGNSGGALLNAKGQVIGVNSAKIYSGGYEGIGFAIPVNIAREVADSLIESGYVKGRPQIGVKIDPRFSEEIARRNGVPYGAMVWDVSPLSAAYRAGIRPGDIITKFNGVTVTDYYELEAEKNKYKAGDTVEIEVYRMPEKGKPSDGVYKTFSVTLDEDQGDG